MDRLDMCEAIELHTVPFVLNPTTEWETFPPQFLEIVQQPWAGFKYFLDDNKTINPEVSNIPNTSGGIYMFLIKPNILPEAPVYLAYVGRARITEGQNLRKRVREYAKEEKRLKIIRMKRYWSPYLYVRYLPLYDNDVINKLEKAIQKAILPPFNDELPKEYNQAKRAAF